MFIGVDSSNSWNDDFDNYRAINIYIDIIAMLLIANIEHSDEGILYKKEINILQLIAHALPELFKNFRVSIHNLFPIGSYNMYVILFQETPINESIIFLFSLIPPKFFLNKIGILEMLIQQLCDPNTPDESLLSIVYLLMKWNKGDTILFALTNLFTQSLNTNARYNQVKILFNKYINNNKI